jgi:hypothetical protein
MVKMVEGTFKKCKENIDELQKAKEEVERVKLERDKHQLMNLILEQEVESQIDE